MKLSIVEVRYRAGAGHADAHIALEETRGVSQCVSASVLAAADALLAACAAEYAGTDTAQSLGLPVEITARPVVADLPPVAESPTFLGRVASAIKEVFTGGSA